MECAECGRTRKPEERGWVVVLSSRDQPKIRYCPECLAEIIRDASGKDKKDD